MNRGVLFGAENMRRVSSLVVTLAAVAIVWAPFADRVAARYVPYARRGYDLVLEKRQDSDLDDDLDQNASAPYQEQDDSNSNNAGGASDGYDDNSEPDSGSYDETPREQEGQADLERFFDDHLGASDRDGMDNENLPSNLFASLAERPEYVTAIPSTQVVSPVLEATTNMERIALPTIETRYIRLPDKKVIITNEITSRTLPAPSAKGNQASIPSLERSFYNWPTTEENLDGHEQLGTARDGLVANDSAIVETEDDEFNRVYVTNDTRKPFRIEELGGFDPEEDFNDASQDIENNSRPAKSKRPPSGLEAESGTTAAADESDEAESESSPKHEVRAPQGQAQQVSFSYPQPETLFEDASETDEITFGQDDPYQTDLEAEMRIQHYDRVGKFSADPVENLDPSQETGEKIVPRETTRTQTRRKSDRLARKLDDDEGGWINDGVEDMDIPSQSHQNMILEKAAKRDALAKRIAEAEAETAPSESTEALRDSHQSEEDGENQRMPNADYMRDDIPEGDDSGYAA